MNSPSSQLERVFTDAIAMPASERAAYLDQACGGDAALRERVLALLAAHSATDSLLRPFVPQLAMSDAPEQREGDWIGRYRLLELIGVGGCGVVWKAEQEEPVRRQVALKVIKLGMDTKAVVTRFEAERQALAMMDHPSIARVYDAGATEAGRPFFVMELVEGVPITKYCDEHRVSPKERLGLFIKVCHAIQHAHQKGVIHRDIKPSNIMVSLVDGVPTPKVIDFGIAKAIEGRLTAGTLFTAFGEFMGTPEYMSPEQIEMTSLDADTRSDIYSLGVLLFELLAGKLPFDRVALKQAGLDEFRRQVREVEPHMPSRRLGTLAAEERTTIARLRGTTAVNLATVLRGDLDWIVMKCIEKDRKRRYETATSLAQDIQRHLDHEPIVARPVSFAYRVRKLIRRNPLAFSSAATVALVLVGGIVVSTRQAIRAERAERAAAGEAARTSAVNEFLVLDLLRSADSRAQLAGKARPNPGLTVREALDRAAEKVGQRFAQQPLTEATVRDAIGLAYDGVGDFAKAALHHQRALELRTKELGADDPSTLKSMNNLAIANASLGKYAEARKLWTELLAVRTRTLGSEHRDTLHTMGNLATTFYFQGQYAEAEALLSRTLEAKQRVLGPDDVEAISTMNNLGNAYQLQGKFAQAEKTHLETLERRNRVLGTEHPDTLASMTNLANVYRNQGKHEEAMNLHTRILEIQKRVLGAEHPGTLVTMNNLSVALRAMGRREEGMALLIEALEIQKRVLGLKHPDTLRSMNSLAVAYFTQGKLAEAESLHVQTWNLRKEVFGPEHPDTLISMGNVASSWESLGKLTEAASLQAEALALKKRTLGPEHPHTLASMNSLAVVYYSQKRLREAADLFAETVALRQRVLGREHPETSNSLSNLTSILEELGDCSTAEKNRRELLEIALRKNGPDSEEAADARMALGQNLLAQKQFAPAEAAFRDALAAWQNKSPDAWQGFETRRLLGSALIDEKKFAEAEPLLLAGYEGLRAREGKIPASDKGRLEEALSEIVRLYTQWERGEQAETWQQTLAARRQK